MDLTENVLDQMLPTSIDSPPTPPGAKLGRKTTSTRPRLWFHDYLENSTTNLVLPESVHRSHREFAWKMLANGPDATVTLNANVAKFGAGCCVPAKMMNAIQHSALINGRPVPPFTADECLRLYGFLTPYDWRETDDDGENPTDQGTDPNEAFTKWMQHGVPLPPQFVAQYPGTSVDQPLGFMAVHPGRPMDWQRAIFEFDFLLRGLAMPLAAQQQRTWDVPADGRLTGEFAPGSWGGHEVLDVSYDPIYTADYTWGEVKVKTRKFDSAYTDQLTVILTKDNLSRTGISPLGFNYDRLRADYEAVYGGRL